METCCESDQDDDHSKVGEDCSVIDISGQNFDMSLSKENILKYRIVQEQWKKLYSVENSCRI